MKLKPVLIALASLVFIIIVAIVSVGVYVVLSAGQSRRRSAERDVVPGWRDSVHYYGRVPAAAAELSLPRTSNADGARILWRDSAGLAPDSLVAAARAQSWEALAGVLAHSDTVAAHNALALTQPDYVALGAAVRALVARARYRLGHRDIAGARIDARAAVGLGEWMARREPSLAGVLAGRAALYQGATALGEIAGVAGDAETLDRTNAVIAWAGQERVPFRVVTLWPDTALALAADTSLALGWRAEALLSAVYVSLERPGAILFGLPRGIKRGIAALEGRGDADFARLARIAEATVQWIDGVGPRERLRLFGSVAF